VIAAFALAIGLSGGFPKGYLDAEAKMAKAKTLYVATTDLKNGAKVEYWFKKPNFWCVRWKEGYTYRGNGRVAIMRAPEKGSKWERADSEPDGSDFHLGGFDSFYESEVTLGEYFGPTTFKVGKQTRAGFNVKLGESAIFWRELIVDGKTLLPAAYSMSEYDELSVNRNYDKVMIDAPIPKGMFDF
jgi:hypothetical protein